MWRVVFTKRAAKDAKNLKAAGLEGKAKRLVEVVRADPFGTPPAYEGLVGSLAGLCSRRISIWHRLVYSVDATPVDLDGTSYEGTVKVVRMWTHYEGVRG
ncbi:Txe/YoeB family addiction module toxin [Thermophilibacter mediterraneus]|uniref:Txe/YoeB family addiction module toxin n=1 Tax=Thermophilibacter mediterraneus TaxID=1871031 RepID=UPI0023522C21|nr:Txe/YoeB family addiction module toxin [Thermophilibacter mediterraneus]